MFHTMIAYELSRHNKTNDDAKFLEDMHKFGINYSLVGVVMFIGGYIGTALINVAAINQIFKIRQEYLRAALNQDLAYFDQHQTGDFASKMSDDVLKLEQGVGDKLSAFVYNLTIALSCIIMAISKGWKLALLCLVTTPITFILVGVSGTFAHRLYKREAVQTGLASAVAEEVLSSIRTVYAFNGQQKEIERYGRPLAEARKISIKKELFTGLSMGFLFFSIFCSYALSFYFGIYLIVHEPDKYNADVMFSVFFGIMTGMTNFGAVGAMMSSFGSARGAAAQIFHLVDNKPTINPYLHLGLTPENIEGNVEFKNVTFHYPSRPDIMILKGVSLSVKRGQSVAFVGQSGCGKSTIIQLISRYYDVIGGSVLVDGHDVRELSVRWLRAQVGLVGQEPVLFNTSVRENIRYGREDASDADIEAAARQANAHQFILKLPKGYETLVGERGASLSGGQKQRIAIARALVRNPSILLLDEATSALDTASEAKVQSALDQGSKGRTTFIVAHRLSTIKNVDLIYVMKSGVVVEIGTHNELIEKKGAYYDLVLLQEPLLIVKGPTAEKSMILNQDEHREEASSSDIPMLPPEDTEKAPSLSFWKILALNAPEWKSVVLGSIAAFFMGFSTPIIVVVFGKLFGSMSNPNHEVMMKEVTRVAITCVGIGLIMGFTSFIETLAFGSAGAHLTERLRLRMFGHLLRQQLEFFDRRSNSTGALCAKLSAEASHVQGATGQRVGTLLQGIASVGLALILAMVYQWQVGLVALAFLPVIALVVYYQSVTTAKANMRSAKTVENSSKIAIEAVANIRTVASLGREEAVLKEYMAQLAPALASEKRATHIRGLVTGLSRGMFNFINASALTYGGHLIVSQGVAYNDILVTTQSLQMAAGESQNAFATAPDFQKGAAAAARVAELLAMEPTITDPPQPVVTDFKAAGEISFKEVEFSYPTRPGVQVLKGLNLQVESFKTIAFVGQSGCGKSTVIQLLERYYDPDAGFVALDGTALTQLLLSEVRASYGLVSQEPVLFDLTIGENIAYGDNSRAVSREEVIDAAKQANIHSFVVTLPEGYDTNIGKKGTQLSGGQKQRVAIARALTRKPKILLLDEATSALDTESEKVVQEALDAAKAGRTCVMIAHRLSTVRDADLICVVHNGRVAEHGTHQQLMDLKKLYYNMHTDIK
ncbi:ATP-dependent translocase ABCB1-like isoform X2 [Choristoneura fumiferana]